MKLRTVLSSRRQHGQRKITLRSSELSTDGQKIISGGLNGGISKGGLHMDIGGKMKIRVWDKILQCYYKGTIESTVTKSGIYGFGLGNRFLPEEYTGFKNWCENDIIRTDHFIDTNGKQQYLYHQIVWSEKYLGWFAKNCGNDGNFNEMDNGNIQLWVFVKGADRKLTGTIHDIPKA